MVAPIYFHKDVHAHSPNVYRLVGKNEDALTYALGHLMAMDDGFMLDALKEVGVLKRVQGKRYTSYREDYKVYLQEQRDVGPSGRRDIVIEAGGQNGLRAVVEAKIGKGQPNACQLLRYTVGCDCGRHPMEPAQRVRRTWGDRKEKFVVVLTRDPPDPYVHREVSTKLRGSGIEVRLAQWHQILRVAWDARRRLLSDAPQSLFLGEFINFFREHYEMKTYQAEVMVQHVDPENAGIYFDGYMYVGGCRHVRQPLYFAPCFTKPCVGVVPEVEKAGISWVSGVVRVVQIQLSELRRHPTGFEAEQEIRTHEHWERWQRGLKAIAGRARTDPRFRDKYDPHQLYFLSKPAPLGRTVMGLRGGKIPHGFKTTFFDLLTKERLGKDSLTP